MISTLEKEVTLRFLKARKKDGFLNVISIFSFIGISLGVAVLIIVMSVLNGFRTELINKIVGFNAHITIKPYERKIDIKNVNQNLISISNNLVFSNSGEAIILKNNSSKGILLRGYEDNDFSKLKIFDNNLTSGNSEILSEDYISIGKELSFTLNLDIGDSITLMSSAGMETIIGNLPKQKTFLVSSIFESGMVEFDNNIAFINLKTLEEFFNLRKKDRNLEIYLKNPQNIEYQKIIAQKNFPNEFVYTWSDMNSSLFSALKVERNVMFIILSLIIIVAAFNIISGLTILIKNKTKEIAILKTLGLNNNSIKKIFFLTGFTIGFFATITGIIIGIIFSINIEKIRIFLFNFFNLEIFPSDVYFLDQLPSEINIYSIFIIFIFSLIISALASYLPAMAISKMKTFRALKYE
mgnify:CR=1 FL=1